jgi:transposase
MRGWTDGKDQEISSGVREWAVRLVLEHREEYASMWAAITSIAQKFGCSAQTLQGSVCQAELL